MHAVKLDNMDTDDQEREKTNYIHTVPQLLFKDTFLSNCVSQKCSLQKI